MYGITNCGHSVLGMVCSCLLVGTGSLNPLGGIVVCPVSVACYQLEAFAMG